MKLQVGKYYVSRGGDVVQIIEHDKHVSQGTADHPYSDDYGTTYTPDGFYYHPHDEDERDLIRVQF